LKVAAGTGTQIFRLADIQYFVGRVFHKIETGTGGKAPYLLPNPFVTIMSFFRLHWHVVVVRGGLPKSLLQAALTPQHDIAPVGYQNGRIVTGDIGKPESRALAGKVGSWDFPYFALDFS
jgi:hypothetical protein